MVDAVQANNEQKELLDAVQKQLGMTPNLVRVFANSPAVLKGYLGLLDGLGKGSLTQKLREQIGLTVAQTSASEYCVAAHTAMGKLAGLNRDELRDARQAGARDGRIKAALEFSKIVVKNRGRVSDRHLESIRDAGYSDVEISEITAEVIFNIFTNYFNHIAEIPIDFPKADPLTALTN
jgi:AhpD family alkylhydroperoxidase